MFARPKCLEVGRRENLLWGGGAPGVGVPFREPANSIDFVKGPGGEEYLEISNVHQTSQE